MPEQPPQSEAEPTRRERVRTATREEIKALAREQMAASGTAALALNAIAKQMGMVPSALYRYYPDRDALLTALLLDSFASLATAVRSADQGADFAERLLATASAYRAWALANPVDFQLVFGNPIPGYQGPVAETGPAMQRVFGVFLDILHAAAQANTLVPLAAFQPALICQPPESDPFAIYPPAVMHAGLVGWSTMHGVTSLEVFGHLRHSLTDGEAFFRGHMREYLRSIGLI